jgi:hypothetical protein
MTRKNYVAIARAIKATADDQREILGALSTLKLAAKRIADEMAFDNPRFDRERFMAACGF